MSETEPSATSPSDAGDATREGLDARDEAILDFERRTFRHSGAKEQAIRDQFGLSSARYYQVLGRLIDSPEALVHDPMLVRRLQRVRAARLESRMSRTRSAG